MMRWSRPEICNAVRELYRIGGKATWAHYHAMLRVMSYCAGTPKRGLKLEPNEKWDGNPNFEFAMSGRSDSDYAKDPDTRRSVNVCSDMFTRNLRGPTFIKHAENYCDE